MYCLRVRLVSFYGYFICVICLQQFNCLLVCKLFLSITTLLFCFSPTMEELRSHQELIHMQDSKTDGKPAFHACHHCTKKFRSQSQLDAHLRLIAQKQLWKDLKTRRMLN